MSETSNGSGDGGSVVSMASDVSNRGHDNIAAFGFSDGSLRFAIDPGTGVLNRLDESHEVTEPVCVTFVEVAS